MVVMGLAGGAALPLDLLGVPVLQAVLLLVPHHEALVAAALHDVALEQQTARVAPHQEGGVAPAHDVVLVVETLVDDHLRHAHDQADVGTGTHGDPLVRLAGIDSLDGIHDDELHAVLFVRHDGLRLDRPRVGLLGGEAHVAFRRGRAAASRRVEPVVDLLVELRQVANLDGPVVVVGGADGPGDAVGDPSHVMAPGASREHERLRAVLLHHLVYLGRDLVDGLIP